MMNDVTPATTCRLCGAAEARWYSYRTALVVCDLRLCDLCAERLGLPRHPESLDGPGAGR